MSVKIEIWGLFTDKRFVTQKFFEFLRLKIRDFQTSKYEVLTAVEKRNFSCHKIKAGKTESLQIKNLQHRKSTIFESFAHSKS